MKAPLLLVGLSFTLGFALHAQTSRKVNPRLQVENQQPLMNKTDGEFQFSTQNLQPTVNNPNKVQLVNYKKMTTSANAFTVAQAGTRNCLTYNKNINAVVFTHRKSNEWLFTNPKGGNSGSIQATWTTNNGVSFDSTIVFVDSVYLGRFPGGAIYNPTGNTNAANAKIVVTGRSTNGSTWNGNYFSFGSLTSGAITTTNQFRLANYATNTTNGNALGGRFSGVSNCMHEVNGVIWSVGNSYGGDINGGTAATNLYNGAVIVKAYSTDNGTSFIWKSDSVKPALAADKDGSNLLYNDPLIAFSPNGQVGYVVMTGMEAGATGSRQAYQPIVYRTMDAGATWTQVNKAYDWAAGNNPCLMASLYPVRGTTVGRPFFSAHYGWDATVDNSNKLHLVCVVSSCSSNHADSLLYTHMDDYKTSFPHVWDLVTEGDGNWKEYLVDSLITKDLSATENKNPWTSGTTKLAYANRIQVSRTNDGSRIFVGWSDSDTNITAEILNVQPDLYFKSINATNMNMAPKKCVRQGYLLCHFMMMSDVTIEKNAGTYQIPFTFTTNSTGDSQTPVIHYYVDDATITDAEIKIPYNCRFTGITETHGAIEAVAQNYPNPFDNTTSIKVSLLSAEDIQLTVMNAMGQMLVSKTVKGLTGENNIAVDGANLANGIYFYSIRVNNDVITKKMIVRR